MGELHPPSFSHAVLLTSVISSHKSPVLSFANATTLVGRVAPTLLDFIALWVQTHSGFDFLVAKTMSAEWVLHHQPVISQHGHEESRFTAFFLKGGLPAEIPSPFSTRKDDHVLYTRFSLGQPMGLLAPCYSRSCSRGTSTKQRDAYVQVTCNQCRRKWILPLFHTTRGASVLGRRDLVAVPFPRETYPLAWGADRKGKELSKGGDVQGVSTKISKPGSGPKRHEGPPDTTGKRTKAKPHGVPKIKTHPAPHPSGTGDPLKHQSLHRAASFPAASSSTGPLPGPLKIRLPRSTPGSAQGTPGPSPTSLSSTFSTPGPSPTDGSHSNNTTSLPPQQQRPARKRLQEPSSPPSSSKRQRSQGRG